MDVLLLLVSSKKVEPKIPFSTKCAWIWKCMKIYTRSACPGLSLRICLYLSQIEYTIEPFHIYLRIIHRNVRLKSIINNHYNVLLQDITDAPIEYECNLLTRGTFPKCILFKIVRKSLPICSTLCALVYRIKHSTFWRVQMKHLTSKMNHASKFH